MVNKNHPTTFMTDYCRSLTLISVHQTEGDNRKIDKILILEEEKHQCAVYQNVQSIAKSGLFNVRRGTYIELHFQITTL